MVRSATLWSILLVATCSLLAVVESREVVCYYGTWAAYRSGNGKLTADGINPALCTQLNYAFFDITSDGNVRIMDDYLAQPSGLNAIGKMNDLKVKNPALKTLAAVGGWSAGTANFKTFVLLTALNKCVNGNTSGATTTTAKPVATTTVKAVTSAPGTVVCTRDGFFRDPSNCSKFYRCVSGTKYDFSCASGLYFNEAITACDYPANVKC
uniref:Uncharacterized protein n=1 Tax=Anopheles dirus TaxID=7168 RepID=A0A182N7X5_9DIPT